MVSIVRIARITIIPDSLGKGEAILHALECLREAEIRPIRCDVTEPSILLASEVRERAWLRC